MAAGETINLVIDGRTCSISNYTHFVIKIFFYIISFLHVYIVSTELNSTYPMWTYIHMSFCVYVCVIKCTIIYRIQMAEPRSAEFGIHMHVDKKSLSTNFRPNSLRPLTFIFKVKIRFEYIGRCMLAYLANGG